MDETHRERALKKMSLLYKIRDDISREAKKEFGIYPELTQRLLVYRDILNREDAESFLNPKYDELIHDPFLLHGMEKGVVRILDAIKRKEFITIYSDYDCDGIPGGVVLHDFFKKINYEHFSNYIPHRHTEGYGLNIPAIEKLAETGTRLIITVDCGITDVEQARVAKKLGIDLIITDHHLQEGTLPDAYVVINPNQKADNSYPNKGICGAGVAFKLVQALLAKGDFNIVAGWEKWLLDMVGMATVADMMPLTDENRALAYYGIQVLRKSRRPGLQKLLRKINVNQRYITEDDIGFMIGPRINAASRMGKPMDAFNLLATDDVVEGGILSSHLDKLNNERKGIVSGMSREIKKRLKKQSEVKPVIVMGNPDWKPSLLGLAANTIADEYKRPVFLWGRVGPDSYKGSCRCDGSINLVKFMKTIEDTFIDAGGHAFAGGFSVKPEHIHNFEDILNDAYKIYPKDDVDHTVLIDRKMTLDDVTWKTYKEIERFAPFGQANPKPLFLFEDITIKVVEHFGKEKNHLRLNFSNSFDDPVSSIAFFKTTDHFEKKIEVGEKITMAANFEKSMFRGRPELRLRIVDIY